MTIPTVLPKDSFSAVKAALADEYDAILSYLPHIIQEDDSEHLHQFRVSIRKSRSILKELGEVFTEGIAQKQRALLSKIAQKTNARRDLDVSLGHLREYAAMLSSKHQDAIKIMANHLMQQHSNAHKALIDYLKSSDFRQTLDAYGYFIESNDASCRGPLADKPARSLVQDVIARLYKKVVKKGLNINDETSSEKYHELRITCKRVRYLIETFEPLLENQNTKSVLLSLKKVQNSLGLYQDLETQQKKINEFADFHSDEKIQKAISKLNKKLKKLQKKEREKFKKLFKTFVETQKNNKKDG